MNAGHTRFAAPQRLLHWLMALCILAMLFIGVGMISVVTPKWLTLVQIHKPLGITILVLALIRLGLRWVHGAPPLPADLPASVRLGATLSHYALYGLMLAMPLIGWGMQSASAHPVLLFGHVQLPPILPVDPMLYALLWRAHMVLGYAFFALILLHLAAALGHKLIRNDGVFETMGPAAQQPPKAN